MERPPPQKYRKYSSALHPYHTRSKLYKRTNGQSPASSSTESFVLEHERSMKVFFGPKIADFVEGELSSRPFITHVFGCIAWLTNEKLLAALAKKTCCQIVVQKEQSIRTKATKAHQLYNQLKCTFRGPGEILAHYKTKGLLKGFCDSHPVGWNRVPGSTDGVVLGGVRCAGHVADDRNSTFNLPRMHHKFLVLADEDKLLGVITGSFNWSNNATASEENVVLIDDPQVAESYLREYIYVLLGSEHLEWKTEMSKPDWAI